MQRRLDHGQNAALILLLTALLAIPLICLADPIALTGVHLYSLDWNWINLQFTLNDTTMSDTVWTTQVADTYRIQTAFYGFILPSPPADCQAFSVEVWTAPLTGGSPTGVLTQVFALGPGEQFSFPETPFWGQWGTWRPVPDTGLLRSGSPDTAIVDERNAYLLNRDRPDAVTLVIAIRTYGGHSHRVASVILNWDDGTVEAVGPGPTDQELPVSCTLWPNYPNPFNSSTRIRFDLQRATFVTLKIYNLLGQEMKVLQQTELAVGSYTAIWDGSDQSGLPAPSGLYLVHLQSTSGNSLVQRAMLVR